MACGPWGCDTGCEVEWRSRASFSGRSVILHSPSGVVVIPVADDDIICDLCGTPIPDDPVPVWLGYALCTACLQRLAGR
jgi:formylmethanofuran dehydrogenase subunit E